MTKTLFQLPLIKGYPNAEHQVAGFDPGSVLPFNAELVQGKQKEIASLTKPNEAQIKELANLMIYGTKEQKAEIASARIDRINIMILENLFGADFFEVVPLEDNEIPHLIIEKDQRWEAMQIGMHGGGPQKQFVNLDTLQQYVPYIVESDIATYPIMSPIIGRFRNVSERVNARVAFDWDRKMDMDLMTLIIASFEATFGDTSLIYDLDPRIENYPTGNYLDLSAQGMFNLTVFRKIFQHFENFGENGPKVRTIYVPTTALEEIWTIGSVVSGFSGAGTVQPQNTVTQQIQTEIQRRGVMGQLYGHTFRLRTLNTIPDGTAYVSTTRPLGRIYTKPMFDKITYFSDKDLFLYNGIKNHEGLQISKTVIPIVPSPWKINALKVTYK